MRTPFVIASGRLFADARTGFGDGDRDGARTIDAEGLLTTAAWVGKKPNLAPVRRHQDRRAFDGYPLNATKDMWNPRLGLERNPHAQVPVHRIANRRHP